MLCYALPVTVTNQRFIGLATRLLSSASGYSGAELIIEIDIDMVANEFRITNTNQNSS